LTRHWFEPKDLAIKLTTFLDVADVDGDVVQILNLHLDYRGRETLRTKKPQMDAGGHRFFGASSRSTVPKKAIKPSPPCVSMFTVVKFRFSGSNAIETAVRAPDLQVNAPPNASGAEKSHDCPDL